ncbi:hypothetical protein [Hoyosella altamirensis]|uniref:RecT family protein n=1 Tax=Hoyosella altamirensis TaxID=616997 RepID=A0A839RW73_9ACTN|nr:hypothetical protein [Hoyosella altamirensis]MBB3040001.1 hypothetical protein [Hoyosella altamirensis]
MSEIEVQSHTGEIVSTTANLGGASLAEQFRQWDEAYRFGQGICRSQIIPEAFRVKPNDVNTGRDPAADIAVVALRAAPLGMDLMTALETMFVVHGRVSMSAKMKAALIRRAGHVLQEVEATDKVVRYYSRRHDTGEEFTSEWTIERAERAKYTKNEKYATNPQQMLRWKCISETGDALYSDVLLGIPTREDLILEGESEPVRASTVAPKGIEGVKARLGVGSHSVNTEPAPQAEPAAQPPAGDATKPQLAKLNMLLEKEGLASKEEKLDWLSKTFKRAFTSSSELSKHEASQCVQFLEGEQAKSDSGETGGHRA